MAIALLAALPAVAAAQTPPTLAGESLQVEPSALGSDSPFFLTCGNGPPSESGSRFTFLGAATGPYLGWFYETGSAVYAPNCDAPPTITEPLEKYSARFTIHSSDAVITGTETMAGAAIVTITGSLGGGGVAVGPVPTTYIAKISTPDLICRERGTSTGMVGQSFGGMFGSWYAGLLDGPFSPTRSLHCQPRS